MPPPLTPPRTNFVIPVHTRLTMALPRPLSTHGAPPMRLTEEQPDQSALQTRAKQLNQEAFEAAFQGGTGRVWADPMVSGRAAQRIVGIDNYFGYLHIGQQPQDVRYSVGLPTGGGVDPFPPLLMPKKYSLSGR